MKYFKTVLAVSMLSGLLCWGMSQAQPGRDGKEPLLKQPADLESIKEDLQIIRTNGMKGDAAELLDYFHNKTLKQPDPKQMALLVEQLGDVDFARRENAFNELVKMGGSTLPLLNDFELKRPRPKLGDGDPYLEQRKRVTELKVRIDAKAEPALQAAAARVLARLKPAGAADKLIAFIPFAADAYVVDQICKSLGDVATREGKAEPILVKSLEDSLAIKRAAAGEALARAAAKDEYVAVKKLFKDSEISVRYRVVIAMVSSQDKDVVPALIELLNDLPPEQAWRAEEALYLLSGDKGPKVRLGTDAATRKACRDAWAKWYADNEKTIDMTKLASGSLFRDFTMITQFNNRIGGDTPGNVGEIFELDENKKIRWKITIPGVYPVDAQVIAGGNRVVVAEYQANRVTERDVVKGEVQWEFACNAPPLQVQRLPNGNTFIAMQNRLMEVDRDKNTVWSYVRPANDIFRARMLPGGEVAFVTSGGTYIRMDARGQQPKQQFQVGPVSMLYGSMEVLPNGNVLVPHYNQARVVEYTQNGNQVGNPVQVNWPNSVVRLPNGNNLIASYQQRKVMEYNANQMIWEYQTEFIVFVARRR